MLSRVLPEKKRKGAVPVYLNVYDLTPINGYAYWFGLGVYHSGVQVHGVEYAFGAHENSGTGVFEVEPKRCPGFIFRKSILIGRTDMGSEQVCNFMEQISREYAGNTYDLITRNCNHFCNDVCIKLTGKAIPRWVNRLARLGLLCNCVLPVAINKTKARQERLESNGVETNKPTTLSTLFRWPAPPPPPPPPQPLSSSWNKNNDNPPLPPSAKPSSKKDCRLPTPSWLTGLPASRPAAAYCQS